MAPLTTLKVGGPARFFVHAESDEQIVDALLFAKIKSLRVFVLGGGSNLLVADGGFDGLVIHVTPVGIEREDELVRAQSGEDWDRFVNYCVENDLAGAECLSGIPGLVGGTPVQNVGAYGQEVSETIVSVKCFDRGAIDFVELANADCGFTYRKSIFNSTQRDRYIVLAVTYRFVPGGPPKIAYKDLRDHFGDRQPSLAEVRAEVLSIRRSKAMVIDDGDPDSRSAGSFFKNPIVTEEKFDTIAAKADGAVPSFPAGEGRVKVPAAWLIEHSGFHKGFQLGNAGISTKHSLAIVNKGGATAAEIVTLKEQIQTGVTREFDVLLEPEPVFVGFD